MTIIEGIELLIYPALALTIFVFGAGIRIIRPTEQGLIERFGKYKRTGQQGFNWIIPLIDQMYKVNITEQMVDIEPQMIITKDKLNVEIDAVVYYKIKDTMKSLYNVDDHQNQLTSLARTTLRAVIGKMSLTEANENRDEINQKVELVLDKETDSYGVELLRVEIQKLEPPQDVQVAMNNVVKAEQAKIAASDFANAKEIESDGIKRAEIKEAEGRAQAVELKAKAKGEAIRLVNESIQKHFKGSAVDYKKLEMAEKALQSGSKYVIDSKSNITTVLSEVAGITPIKGK